MKKIPDGSRPNGPRNCPIFYPLHTYSFFSYGSDMINTINCIVSIKSLVEVLPLGALPASFTLQYRQVTLSFKPFQRETTFSVGEQY